MVDLVFGQDHSYRSAARWGCKLDRAANQTIIRTGS